MEIFKLMDNRIEVFFVEGHLNAFPMFEHAIFSNTV